MKATITIRLDARQQKAVTDAARRQGTSVSDVVREALDRTLSERPVSGRAGHVKGRLRLAAGRRTAWRDTIRARNWRS